RSRVELGGIVEKTRAHGPSPPLAEIPFQQFVDLLLPSGRCDCFFLHDLRVESGRQGRVPYGHRRAREVLRIQPQPAPRHRRPHNDPPPLRTPPPEIETGLFRLPAPSACQNTESASRRGSLWPDL